MFFEREILNDVRHRNADVEKGLESYKWIEAKHSRQRGREREGARERNGDRMPERERKRIEDREGRERYRECKRKSRLERERQRD